MARTNIAAQTTPGAYPSLPIAPDARDITFTGSDVPNGNETPLIEAKTLVLVHNTEAVTARTCTFVSVADTLNRTGDITAYSVEAGETALFGPFKTVGWASSGKLRFDGSNIALKFAVI